MPPPALHNAVLDAVGRAITSGDVAPGTPLTLESIGTQHHVSRTVAREVMRMLEGLGLVRSRRRVGLVVLPREEWNVLDPRVIRWRLAGPGRDEQLRTLTELRHAVEPLAAAGAARHASAAERAELVDLAARMRVLGSRGDLTDFLALDVRMHELLLRASGNEMFGALAVVVAEVLAGRTHLGLMPASPVPEALDQHEAVAHAVAAGDAPAAEAAMAALVGEVRRALDTATPAEETP
ncbi:GntR family transcriptional regulator [Isoptericola sp. CG 20/1183]|uniref:GntR family transcriptional regulator n=1 Tax=Isoptericola halotolerans TaxID=300560 RepID=A0ABX5EE87_9MICO|nr:MULTISPECIES: FCD domain-containing protein [Isoptericola]PRZ06984.1 GntR family transcriptional regulator [Isoptericola halotolerans]PRZ07344.1 GntR family transcriptional regulator [Isoptericola sp. CG 20/1183]